MVVDGLPPVRDFTRHLLQGMGFDPVRLRCCANPEAALAQAVDCPPQLLITDGFHNLTTNWKQLHEQLSMIAPDCQLAIMSSVMNDDLQAQAEAAGALFLIKKPFTAVELKTALQNGLQKLAKQRPDLASRLQSRAPAVAAPAAMRRPAPAIVAPPQPVLRPGDKVRYENKTEVVDAVVIRQGELVVQLKNKAGLVPVSKLQPG